MATSNLVYNARTDYYGRRYYYRYLSRRSKITFDAAAFRSVLFRGKAKYWDKFERSVEASAGGNSIQTFITGNNAVSRWFVLICGRRTAKLGSGNCCTYYPYASWQRFEGGECGRQQLIRINLESGNWNCRSRIFCMSEILKLKPTATSLNKCFAEIVLLPNSKWLW